MTNQDHWSIPRKSCGQLEREAAIAKCDEEHEIHYDNVNHPSHYTSGGIECIDAMESAFGSDVVSNFCLCNAFKYIFRCLNKDNTIEDVEKARWYLDKYLALNDDRVNL